MAEEKEMLFKVRLIDYDELEKSSDYYKKSSEPLSIKEFMQEAELFIAEQNALAILYPSGPESDVAKGKAFGVSEFIERLKQNRLSATEGIKTETTDNLSIDY